MTEPVGSSPQPTQPEKSKLWPIVLTIIGGVLLAFISCGGMLGSLEGNAAANAFAVGFFAGLAILIGGCVAAVRRSRAKSG